MLTAPSRGGSCGSGGGGSWAAATVLRQLVKEAPRKLLGGGPVV
jgi:hypothetical protein